MKWKKVAPMALTLRPLPAPNLPARFRLGQEHVLCCHTAHDVIPLEIIRPFELTTQSELFSAPDISFLL